jgi:hypothetical protein
MFLRQSLSCLVVVVSNCDQRIGPSHFVRNRFSTLLPSFLRAILFLRRSKCSVRTVCRAVVVRGDNAEIIGGARTQAADVDADVKYMSPA